MVGTRQWILSTMHVWKAGSMISSVMNNHRLDTLIREHGNVDEGQLGHWRFEYQDRSLLVMSDEMHNRMRIITPVAEVNDLGDQIWLLVLTANFDRALVARYAINGDYLWSAYIHPLQELTDDQFLDGLRQVVTLADNFGTSFSSGDLMFDGQ